MTVPDDDTVPIAVLDDDHVPPVVVQFNVVVCPLQSMFVPEIVSTDGVWFTVTAAVTPVVEPHTFVAAIV